MSQEENKIINTRAYKQDYFPPVPTAMTKFFRNNLLWQFVRFVAINLKMIKVVRKSHH